ncbi:hypothetical protein RI367_006868 [Sorochytrium milnesiophthora]
MPRHEKEDDRGSDPVDDDKKEDDGSEEEAEYDVEAITRHKMIDGTLHFYIKWKGYAEDQNSWEPMQNVSEDLVQAYLDTNGIDKNGRKIHATRKPVPSGKKASAVASSSVSNKKRTSAAEESPAKNKKKQKTASADEDDDIEEVTDKPAAGAADTNGHSKYTSVLDSVSGSWEKHVVRVATLEQGPKGVGLLVHLLLTDKEHDGITVVYPSKVVRKKCPQALLDFYEHHLRFKEMENAE